MATVKSNNDTRAPWLTTGKVLGSLAFITLLSVTIFALPKLKTMVEEYQNQQKQQVQIASSAQADGNEAHKNIQKVETNDWQIAFESPVDFINPVELDQYVKTRLKMNFFSLDVNEASKVLLDFPWIKKVTARKVWPNTLVVKVDEHQPWLNLNNTALISTEGELFEPSNIDMFNELPVLKGKFGKVEDLLSMYQFFSEQMPTNDFRITELEFSLIDGWHMTLKNGIRLMIGNKDLADRLDRFLSIIEQLPPQKTEKIKYLDMRYQTGVAVGWRALKAEQVARL
ncbi:MAG: FtsQ-type POTRA domain-containing protein [Gammaproteobacteria bacterium]|nr:FtsQ-type POTRA domain-containing protein [Gammaproteobacteria bacterium]